MGRLRLDAPRWLLGQLGVDPLVGPGLVDALRDLVHDLLHGARARDRLDGVHDVLLFRPRLGEAGRLAEEQTFPDLEARPGTLSKEGG